MFRPAADRRRACGGFTIIEVLVALAVMATMIASISALAGSNARASLRLDQRVALAQTARAVEAGIPPRSALRIGRLEGEIAGHDWQMQVRPLRVDGIAKDSTWVPRDVAIQVRSPSGALMQLNTVRLVRSEAR